MHLKRIRTRNFKSFSGVTEIPFTPGFTGIAGPNGMGKSNIADAVLFVLGPTSSKALRADRLTHLLFNGGSSKKAATECEVALQFDNRDRLLPVDSDEVELSRYVKIAPSDPDGYYSYFYVNGRRSTQGELDNILAHARLSGDGYNIVQQGDVNRIVSMGPIPRRGLVERLAGIAQYDDELDRAATRRTELEQNLDRINTLLTEIRSHLEGLEGQRVQAIQYKQLQDEKRHAEARLARAGALLARQEVETCESQVKKITEQIVKFRADVARLEGQRDQLAAKISEIESEIARRSGEDAQKFKTELDGRRMAFATLEERYRSTEEDLTQLKQKAAALAPEVQRAEKEAGQLTAKERALHEELTGVEEALATSRRQLDAVTGQTENSRGKLLEIRKQSLVGQKKLEEREAAWQAAIRLREAARGTLSTAEGEKARAEDERENRGVELRDLELRLKQSRPGGSGDGSTAAELQRQFLDLKSKEQRSLERAEALAREVQELNRRYLALDARLKAATRPGSTASPAAAVDFLLSQRNLGKVTGIRGTVEELAEYDPKHQTALTVAAGSRFQALVVETDAVAEQCIKMLREEKRGRATFLPLNRMLPGRPHGKSLIAARASGAVGFALDLLKFEEALRPVFWYVFGETVVMENLTAARDQMGGVRLVTLQGDLIEATGAITGGYVDSGGRNGPDSAAELKRLGGELREKSAAEAQVRTELTALTAQIRTLAEELGRRAGQDESHASAVKELTQQLEQARNRLKESRERVATAEKALADATAQLAKSEASAQSIEAEVNSLKVEHQKLQEEYLGQMPGAISEKVRGLQETIQKDEESRVTLERDLGATRASLKAAKDQLAARWDELKQLENERTEKKKLLASVQAERDQAKASLDALRAVETKLTSAAQELSNQKTKLEGERLKTTELLTKASGQVETQTALQQHEEVRLAQARQALAEVEEALRQFPATPEEDAQPVPIDQLKRSISQLNAQLESMGSVNLRALDEYEAEKKRLDEFDAETRRLTGEKGDLQKLVDEIEKKKRSRLIEVVAAVNQAFHEVYLELSNGGEGEVVLENPDDPLQAGLLIRASPTGKKVYRLEQLSGGEKSLASLAFVFALQRYDPSPLYVFDEVDMSLDAVNAENLGRMLRRNAERAQFIVISLRKVTLKFAHRLFGVTMHGDGCSRVVGLGLDEIVDADERDRSAEVVSPSAGEAA
jgi:chromosome segregation protein